eukprot:9163404-Pyramimonas_sp.AAC.1
MSSPPTEPRGRHPGPLRTAPRAVHHARAEGVVRGARGRPRGEAGGAACPRARATAPSLHW